MKNFEYYKSQREAHDAFVEKLCYNQDVNFSFADFLYQEHVDKCDLLVHTPIFDLYRMNEVEPGFRPIQIKSPNWVSVIVERNDSFLTVSQMRYGVCREMLEFPSGMVEPNEISRNAALRELQEETGYVLDTCGITWIGSVLANPAFMTNQMDFWYCDISNICEESEPQQGEQELDAHEHIKVKWTPKKEIFRMVEDVNTAHVSTFLPSALFYYERFKRHENT